MYYKTTLVIWCCLLLSAPMGWSQLSTVAISEVNSNDQVELINTGTETVNVSSLWLCDFPAYVQVSNLTIECGDINLAPGGVIVFSGWTVNEDDAELGIYLSSAFGSSTAIIDYVEWGSSNHQRSAVAVAAGIWEQGDFVPAFQSDESLLHDGSGNSPDTWMAGGSSLCAPNGSSCDVEGGTLEGGPFTICAGDGEADMLMPGDITLTGNSGTNSAWVVTELDGTILGLPPMPSAVNFDGAGPGECLIWHLSFEDGLMGAEVGMNANDLEGCFSLSNPVSVIRQQPEGGTLEGGPFSFTAGDGVADNIPAGAIILTGNSGMNSAWVVTDNQGNILGLPPSPEAVDFDGAGAGLCLVWHLSFEDGLTGAEVGKNANDLEGCYSLSNPIEVNRQLEGDCQANGGQLFGGPFTFCVEDGMPDNIEMGAITLANVQGTNSAWVVTDDMGNILGLPPMPSAVNFDDAPAGVCQVWHLSYEDGISGLAVGQNANDLEGCFSLSNPVTVNRVTPIGGTLEGGPFTICAGDGEADMLMPGDITLTGNSGTNSAWVVTELDGTILGLPPMPSAVNFDGAGPGECLIWHLSFEDGLVGAEVGMNANDLEGCFSLSNPVSVIRQQPEGGTLEGGPFTICAGDGEADMLMPGDITLTGNSGTNSAWVVTELDGTILGLPPMPSAVNFDGAGPGECLIWHLSFEDGLMGAEVGMNANDLEGCFSLSNPVSVIRQQPEGGTLEGGPFTICAGDGEADMLMPGDITLTGNSGTNSAWVVTELDGTILGLPPMPSAVNFDGAGPGECQIWHLSFEDGLVGAEVGMNANDLEGCFSLSNPVSVIRQQPEGGTLEGGPFTFCVGDGEADNIPEGEVTLTGNEGVNSAWIVTDEDGNILGLPPSPSAVNFDDAPAGNCLVWHLSYEDGLEGLEVDQNANDLVGCFSLSNPVTVERVIEGEACISSTEEVNPASVDLNIWPNPVGNVLQLSAVLESRPAFIQFEIRSSVGQVLVQREREGVRQLNESFDLSNLPKGYYMISLRTNETISTQAFIKQ